jgi:hypothetical protein
MELECTEKVAVVGQRHSRHAEGRHLPRQIRNLDGRIE